MDWGEIRAAARVMLQEPTVDFYTNEELLVWANWGLDKFCRLSEVMKDYATITTAVGVDNYDFPNLFLKVMMLQYNEVLLRKKDPHQIQKINNSWRTADNGTPAYYYFMVSGQISLYQKPDAVVVMPLWYIKLAQPLSGTGSTPQIPVDYHPALVFYVVARAKEKDGQLESARYFMDSFKEFALSAKVDGAKKDKYDKLQSYYPAIQK